MARASRHYIPGNVWHITHRCHKKEFLLKFGRDRRRWIEWLFEARKRYGLKVLNYIVTSNHVHLLVADDGDERTIPESIQLMGGLGTCILTVHNLCRNFSRVAPPTWLIRI
jgi:putative transposase